MIELEEARLRLAQSEVEIARLRQEIRNLVNDGDLTSRLIEQLPELASQMPEIDELRILQSDAEPYNALASFLAQIKTLMNDVKFTNGASGDNN